MESIVNLKQLDRWVSLATNVGVLVGIVLLVLELNQNTNLMRAEMHAMRAEAKASRQMEQANSGEIVRILYEASAAGFPQDPKGLDVLAPEDRYRFTAFLAGLSEAVQNWHYQCQQELLDEELCRSGYENQARGLIVWSHALDMDFSASRPSFVADLRRLATESGLPVPSEDGTWK
jgi:hypothetical protein